jgi:hypothetical protein
MSYGAVASADCPNCGRAVDGASFTACGQKVTPTNPRLPAGCADRDDISGRAVDRVQWAAFLNRPFQPSSNNV